MLTNVEIAERLIRIRRLMELSGETFFKYMAYERAASAIENAAPVGDLIRNDELRKLAGIGKTIAGVVQELAESGSAQYLDQLAARYPSTIFELLDLQGVGMKSAATLFEQFGIGSVNELKTALDRGQLDGAPRMGPKTLENLRRAVLAYQARHLRTPLGRAHEIAEEVLAYLRAGPGLEKLTVAGSVRRAEVFVGDIDLVCTAADPQAVIAYFVAWQRARAVLAEGPTKASIWLAGGLQVDLRVLPDHLYGNLLQHFTGSREHNIRLREYAVRKNLRVSENGILELETGRTIICSDEAGVYAALGMQYIPPELRLGIGEIEEALAHAIPRLVERADIRGDFHMHTTWSDGKDPVEQMVRAAAARGYQYQAVSDHSWGRGRRNLSAEELRAQRVELQALGERHGIRCLSAVEVDVLSDGALDYRDDQLAEMDVVIASVHSEMNQSREMMTARLIRVCENPYVTIVGHPTGRRLGTYPGYEFDYDAVFAAAARTGTALEIDGQAVRLDLPSELVRRARGFGVTFTTDSDAHRAGDLANLDLAVGQARRGGLTADQVLNARPLAGVLEFASAKRAGA